MPKICVENFPPGKFRETPENSRRENFSGISPEISPYFRETAVQQSITSCVGRFPGRFFPHFWDNLSKFWTIFVTFSGKVPFAREIFLKSDVFNFGGGKCVLRGMFQAVFNYKFINFDPILCKNYDP